MGEVYLARQRGLDGFQKLVVIKTLLPHLCEDEEFITMFKDEARLTAQLIHPNICQVFEFDQVGDTYYLAMEYLRGEDLRRLWKACELRATPLRVPLICRIIADSAAGLDFAHSLRDSSGAPFRIVHRDISPQNILVTFEGGVKIIDFGVAKAAGRAQHTRTGALKGKYSYMSPEQVAGQDVDGRSDLFALGIVLHELLTGRRLFKAESDVQTLARVREAHVDPPSRLNPQLPAGLDAIVLKALAKKPRDRFETAQKFRLALEDWLIQGRMSASSAHLAEFLKVVYQERLEKESRLGPLLGDAGLTVQPGQWQSTPPGNSPSPSASLELRGPAPMGATVNQRQEGSNPSQSRSQGRSPSRTAGKSEIDSSMVRTESGASPFGSRKQTVLLAVVIAGVVAIGTVQLLRRPPDRAPTSVTATEQPATVQLQLTSEPAGALVTLDGKPYGKTPLSAASLRPGPVRIELSLDGFQPLARSEQLGPGAQARDYRLERTALQKVNLVVKSEPEGAEVMEGDMVLGTTPYVWNAPVGPHRLSFSLSGYRDVTETVNSSPDEQPGVVRLKKLEKVHSQARDLGIKAER